MAEMADEGHSRCDRRLVPHFSCLAIGMLLSSVLAASTTGAWMDSSPSAASAEVMEAGFTVAGNLYRRWNSREMKPCSSWKIQKIVCA